MHIIKRITELFILEGDLWRSCSQTPLLQNRLIAAGCSGLWLVKFWVSPRVEVPHLPGQSVLVFNYPVNKTASLMFKCSFLYSICAHWLLPVLGLSGPVFFTVSRYLCILSRCHQSFIFSGLDSPSCLSPGAIPCTCFNISTSHQCCGEGKHHFPWPAENNLPHAAQAAASLLYFSGVLLAHNPWSWSTWCPPRAPDLFLQSYFPVAIAPKLHWYMRLLLPKMFHEYFFFWAG